MGEDRRYQTEALPSMGGDKRKARNDWTEAAIIDDTGLRGAYLARFSGVVPPETTTFREYKRKRNGDQNVEDPILQGETERIEFEGKTKTADVDNCQYAIGILNQEAGTVKLLLTPMVQMQRSIKALKSKSARAASETPTKIRERRIALGEAFGSKRSKAAIQSQLSSQVDTKALESVASQIFDNVRAATENMPSQDTLMDEINADRPIPAIDLSASTPADLYSLDSIVSDSEFSMIESEAIYSLPDEATRLAAFPYKNSQFVNDRLKILFKQGQPDHKRLRMLFYASLLMAFFKNHRLASKRTALKNVLGPIPNRIIDGLLSRYTEDQLSGSGEHTKKRSICTSKCQDKVVCYLFVLCLMLDDYTVDINQLAHDLQLKPKKATELFKTVGCKIVAISDSDREKRGITKSEAKTYKLAKLKCPPEFPRVRRPAAKAGRR